MNLIPLDNCDTSKILTPGPFYVCHWDELWEDAILKLHRPALSEWLAQEMAYDTLEEFTASQGFVNWERALHDRLFPAMDYAWSVCLPSAIDPGEAVALMQGYGLATSLVTPEVAPEGLPDGRHTYITLTTGAVGVSDNLRNWDIAGAYLCCGAVPPLALLKSLSTPTPTAALAPQLFGKVLGAIHFVQSYLHSEIDWLDQVENEIAA